MSISGPIFTAGAITAQKRQAIASWEQTKAQYNQTALSAFRDVSDALITREKLDAIRAEQAKAVQSNEDAVRLMSMRFTNGRVGGLEVLESKQRLYSSQLALEPDGDQPASDHCPALQSTGRRMESDRCAMDGRQLPTRCADPSPEHEALGGNSSLLTVDPNDG